MRVFDCDCGKQLEASDDEQLYNRVWEHMEQSHFDRGLGNEEIKDLVSEKAYTQDAADKGPIDEHGSVGG
jgi:predicted small metal-binding protein